MSGLDPLVFFPLVFFDPLVFYPFTLEAFRVLLYSLLALASTAVLHPFAKKYLGVETKQS